MTLTETADNETCLTIHSPSAVADSFNLTPRRVPTASAFTHAVHFRTRRGLAVWACVRWALTREPYGTFDHFVALGVLVNASTINLKHRSDAEGVRCSRLMADR